VGLEPAFLHGTPASFPAIMADLPPEPDDPEFTIPRGALLADLPEPREAIDPSEAELAAAPAGALERRPAALRKPSGWTAMLGFSCLLHAAAALAFLAVGADKVMIAGSEDAGLLLLGNADADQAAAGEPFPDSTQVTLVTMLAPQPVQTVAAEAVEPVLADMASAPDVVEPAVQETLAPVEAETVPVASEAVEPTVTTPSAATAPVQALEMVEDEPLPAQATDPAPPILTAEIMQPVEDAAGAPPLVEKTAPEPVEKVETATMPDVVDPVPEPGRAERKATEKPVEKAVKEPAPKPEKERPAKKKATEKKQAKAEKPAEKDGGKAGSGGESQADAKRGLTGGDARGTRTETGRKGTLSAAGNAAVSNYPGKVAARLRRASRGISGSGRSRAAGDVRVTFTVTASGGLAGVRIASSSGSPDLDKAALAIVRRAAPFPPIPPEAGRQSWAFTLPLGVR